MQCCQINLLLLFNNNNIINNFCIALFFGYQTSSSNIQDQCLIITDINDTKHLSFFSFWPSLFSMEHCLERLTSFWTSHKPISRRYFRTIIDNRSFQTCGELSNQDRPFIGCLGHMIHFLNLARQLASRVCDKPYGFCGR